LPWGFVDLDCKQPRCVYIHSIWTYSTKRGRGYGARTLAALCHAADELGYSLTLAAFAYGRSPALATSDLIKWYARYGFIVCGFACPNRAEMRRRPQVLAGARVA
jgi:L-amino acid N-acyltransferase YncA